MEKKTKRRRIKTVEEDLRTDPQTGELDYRSSIYMKMKKNRG